MTVITSASRACAAISAVNCGLFSAGAVMSLLPIAIFFLSCSATSSPARWPAP